MSKIQFVSVTCFVMLQSIAEIGAQNCTSFTSVSKLIGDIYVDPIYYCSTTDDNYSHQVMQKKKCKRK